MISKNVNNPLLVYSLHHYTEIPFYFWGKTWSYNIVHYRQYIASIAAAEKRPLSYQTPQSIDRARYCGVWWSGTAIYNA